MAATTLLEELAQAAEDADLLAETMQSEHYRQRAARLRARLARVESYHGEHPHADETCPYCVAVRWVTMADIPGQPEPARPS